MSERKIDLRYMEFRLGDQYFALPLLAVKEVIPMPEVTPVPNMSSHFEGMINLRGQILGVYNVRQKLSVKARETRSKVDVVIVIEQSGVSVGMTVDEVTRVIHVAPNLIGPAPLREGGSARAFIDSVIRMNDRLILAINVGTLLEIEKNQAPAKSA